jgi:hypothetical protein
MDTEFAQLVARAKRGEPKGREALLGHLRPILIAIGYKEFKNLRDGFAEILDDCENTLLRWLVENPDLVHEDRGAGNLAWRLLAQCGKQWVRDQTKERSALREIRLWFSSSSRRAGKRGGHVGFWQKPEELPYEVEGVDAVKAIAELGEPHRSTLIAEVEHQLDGGPSLEERFGLTPLAARKRLSRAREAVLELIRNRGTAHE